MNAVSRVDEPTVPWHRVINSKGGISLPENSKSAAIQRARLRAEMPCSTMTSASIWINLAGKDLTNAGWRNMDFSPLAQKAAARRQ